MFATIPVSLNKLTQQILHGFWFLQWRLLCLDRHERRKLRCEGDTLLTYHHGKWYSCVCLCAVCPSADMHFEATVKESILHSSVPEGCAHGQLGCKTLRKEQPFVQQNIGKERATFGYYVSQLLTWKLKPCLPMYTVRSHRSEQRIHTYKHT